MNWPSNSEYARLLRRWFEQDDNTEPRHDSSCACTVCTLAHIREATPESDRAAQLEQARLCHEAADRAERERELEMESAS